MQSTAQSTVHFGQVSFGESIHHFCCVRSLSEKRTHIFAVIPEGSRAAGGVRFRHSRSRPELIQSAGAGRAGQDPERIPTRNTAHPAAALSLIASLIDARISDSVPQGCPVSGHPVGISGQLPQRRAVRFCSDRRAVRACTAAGRLSVGLLLAAVIVSGAGLKRKIHCCLLFHNKMGRCYTIPVLHGRSKQLGADNHKQKRPGCRVGCRSASSVYAFFMVRYSDSTPAKLSVNCSESSGAVPRAVIISRS